ncbi:hypothetical protein [Actinomyces sp. 432]|uniref:hypothetical protein n=1 Tax=Actinomyces sp. 432 TaxID=2057798 RepID=UPI0013796F74|nr:hypothetical protein [Actinomyces sp. 432]
MRASDAMSVRLTCVPAAVRAPTGRPERDPADQTYNQVQASLRAPARRAILIIVNLNNYRH